MARNRGGWDGGAGTGGNRDTPYPDPGTHPPPPPPPSPPQPPLNPIQTFPGPQGSDPPVDPHGDPPPPPPPKGHPTGGGQHRKPPTPPRPASDRTLTVVATGSTIPVTYGHVPVGGGIFRARVVGQYFYIAFGIGEGPINAVKAIRIDGRNIGTGRRNGKVGLGYSLGSDYYVHLGTADQTFDPFLHEITPTHITGYPGFAYIVVRFRPPNSLVGTFDPTRIEIDIEGKLTRDMRTHQPHKDPLTATVGAAGALTGEYYYKYTDETADWETAGSPPSNKVTLSSQRATLDDIIIDTLGVATSRKVYRTLAGAGVQGPYYYALTVPDNTTEDGIDDNVPDASLGEEIPYVQTEYTYSEDGILHRYDVMTNVTFGGGIPERRIDGVFGGTFGAAADDCDNALVLPAPPAGAPVLAPYLSRSNIPVGSYYYSYTNVDSAGIESLESATDSISVSGLQRVTVGSIEVSGGSVVKHRIYRNDTNSGADSPRRYVDEVADGTTSYIDNMLPESLGHSAPTQQVRYTMSLSLRDTRTLQEWIDVFDQHYMGYGVYNSGVFQVFIDKAKDPCGLSFTDQGTDANIVDLVQVQLKGSSNNPNVITVQFSDSSRDFDDGFASAETEAVTLRTEQKREKRYSLPGITSYDQAKRMAIHLLNLQHFADKTISFTATPEAIRVLPGDIILVTSVVGMADAPVLVREVEPVNGGMQYHIVGDFYSDDTYSDVVQQDVIIVPTIYPDPHAPPPPPPSEVGFFAGPDEPTTKFIYWDQPRVYRPNAVVNYGTAYWTPTNLGSYDGDEVNNGDLDTAAFVSNTGNRALVMDLGSGNDVEFGRCTVTYQDPLVADNDARMGYTFNDDNQTATGIEYSDDGAVWYGVTGLVRLEGQMAGDRHLLVEWRDPGAHRYWKIYPGTALVGQINDAHSPVYTDVQFEAFEDYPYVDHYDIYDMRQVPSPGSIGWGRHTVVQGSLWRQIPGDQRPTVDAGLNIAEVMSGGYAKLWVTTVNKAQLVSDTPCVYDYFSLFTGYGLQFITTAGTGITDFYGVPTVGGVPITYRLMKWMGTWSALTTYALYDVVELSGSTYVAISTSINQTPPNVLYWVPLGGGGSSTTYVAETPSGSVDSSNLVFTLAHTPAEEGELTLNEAILNYTTHYTRSGTTITLVAGQAPDDGDEVRYRYRY